MHRHNLAQGGVIVVSAGNFGQIPPLIPQGTKVNELNSSHIWSEYQKHCP